MRGRPEAVHPINPSPIAHRDATISTTRSDWRLISKAAAARLTHPECRIDPDLPHERPLRKMARCAHKKNA
jgi:hypothetical protein